MQGDELFFDLLGVLFGQAGENGPDVDVMAVLLSLSEPVDAGVVLPMFDVGFVTGESLGEAHAGDADVDAGDAFDGELINGVGLHPSMLQG